MVIMGTYNQDLSFPFRKNLHLEGLQDDPFLRGKRPCDGEVGRRKVRLYLSLSIILTCVQDGVA